MLTLEQVPNAVENIMESLRDIKSLLAEKPKEDVRMTLKEAAKYLDISPDTLKRKCYARLIPYVKQGASIVFYKSMIEEYEKKIAIPAINS